MAPLFTLNRYAEWPGGILFLGDRLPIFVSKSVALFLTMAIKTHFDFKVISKNGKMLFQSLTNFPNG